MELCELWIPLHPVDVTVCTLVPLMICINSEAVRNSLPSYYERACFHKHTDVLCAYFTRYSVHKM